MKKILLSIKPQFVNQIRSGQKIFEYRKKLPINRNITKMLIYESSPVMKVVAECEILEYLWCKPSVLWNLTSHNSGISKEFFDEYFKGRDMSGAIMIGNVTFFKVSKSLEDYNVNRAPQSFQYIED